MTDAQMSVQITSETSQLQAGKDRYLKQQERVEKDKGFSGRDATSKLIGGMLPKVSKALKLYLGSNKGAKADAFLSLLDIDLLSLIALSGCFNACAGDTSITRVTTAIGRNVEAEIWALDLHKKDRKLYERLVLRATKTHGSLAYRKKAVRATAAKEGFASLAWDADLQAKVGEPLLNAVLTTCPELFEIYLDTVDPRNTPRRIGLTEGAWDIINANTEDRAWMEPMFLPMLTPPKPWTAFNSGAYVTKALSSKVPLIRTWDSQHISLVKAAIADGSMAPCLEALNAIQDTQWAINGPLLDLVGYCWETNQNIEGFPKSGHLPRLQRPEDYDTLTPDQQKAWRIKASQTATRNRGIDSDRVTMLQDLGVAQSLSHVPRFFLPHNLDFRGRCYAVPSFNGQRADHIRAMLHFANPKALGDSGAYWLAIHLANTGAFRGVDKQSLEDRFAWTTDHEELIKEIASDPYSTIDTWKEADKPFQFVAACIEYAGFLEEGEDYLSQLPIALDGSNSGLQHYSASLRSPEGSLVNLTPQDTPADLYQAVADLVVTGMEADAAGDGINKDIAILCLKNGVTRKLVKRNAMTFSYSSGEYGFKQQHMTDLMRPLDLKVLSGELPSHPYGEDGGYKAAGYIAKATYKAITSLVKDATAGMKFFQHCAGSLAHEGKGLVWITPTGLPVSHRYTDWDTKKVKMFLHDKNITVDELPDGTVSNASGTEIRLTVRHKPTERINKDKAKSAVSPNVIHSLDAAHLMLTVLKAKAQGITDFGLIHDSFATHASNTSEFFYIIREAFIDLYENYCPYQTIYNATYTALDDKSRTPPVPQKGNLDVQQVFNSLYAFA
jgi:DNA-directed RNA polymerase